MRLVTAVTTFIQLKPNYFRPKKSALRNRIFVRAATSYRQRLVRVSRVVLAVEQRFLASGSRGAIGIFCKQVCLAGR
jgi:hypothetical protein